MYVNIIFIYNPNLLFSVVECTDVLVLHLINVVRCMNERRTCIQRVLAQGYQSIALPAICWLSKKDTRSHPMHWKYYKFDTYMDGSILSTIGPIGPIRQTQLYASKIVWFPSWKNIFTPQWPENMYTFGTLVVLDTLNNNVEAVYDKIN